MESRKMVQMKLSAGQDRVTDVEDGHVDTVRDGERSINWERTNNVSTTMCKTDSSCEAAYRTESSAQCSVMTQRGGREAQEGGSVCTQIADRVVQQKLKSYSNKVFFLIIAILVKNAYHIQTTIKWRASLIVQLVKNLPAVQETLVPPLRWKIC